MTSLARVPCTIVTGFLGSGKTTLIRHVLANANGRRLAVIVNEFGDEGIDGEILKGCGDSNCSEENIVELANGCLCCTVADEFVPALDEILARKPEVDHFVLETSGLALPKPLVQAFHWPAIKSRVTVDGVVAVVDGAALSGSVVLGSEDGGTTISASLGPAGCMEPSVPPKMIDAPPMTMITSAAAERATCQPTGTRCARRCDVPPAKSSMTRSLNALLPTGSPRSDSCVREVLRSFMVLPPPEEHRPGDGAHVIRRVSPLPRSIRASGQSLRTCSPLPRVGTKRPAREVECAADL